MCVLTSKLLSFRRFPINFSFIRIKMLTYILKPITEEYKCLYRNTIIVILMIRFLTNCTHDEMKRCIMCDFAL